MVNGVAARNNAIILSVALHAAFFWAFADTLLQQQGGDRETELPPVMVNLLPVPKPQATEKPVTTSVAQPLAQPEPQAQPAPPPEPTPQLEAMPEPEPTQLAEVTEPVAAPAEPLDSPQQRIDTETPMEAETTPAAATAAVSTPAVDAQALAQRREQYLALLQSRIAVHKFYPAMARRRGVEGEVEVSFVLLADGDARDIRVHGGPGMLRGAARQAVQKALRLPAPPEEIATPLQVQYAMNFSLH